MSLQPISNTANSLGANGPENSFRSFITRRQLQFFTDNSNVIEDYSRATLDSYSDVIIDKIVKLAEEQYRDIIAPEAIATRLLETRAGDTFEARSLKKRVLEEYKKHLQQTAEAQRSGVRKMVTDLLSYMSSFALGSFSKPETTTKAEENKTIIEDLKTEPSVEQVDQAKLDEDLKLLSSPDFLNTLPNLGDIYQNLKVFYKSSIDKAVMSEEPGKGFDQVYDYYDKKISDEIKKLQIQHDSNFGVETPYYYIANSSDGKNQVLMIDEEANASRYLVSCPAWDCALSERIHRILLLKEMSANVTSSKMVHEDGTTSEESTQENQLLTEFYNLAVLNTMLDGKKCVEQAIEHFRLSTRSGKEHPKTIPIDSLYYYKVMQQQTLKHFGGSTPPSEETAFAHTMLAFAFPFMHETALNNYAQLIGIQPDAALTNEAYGLFEAAIPARGQITS